MVQDKSRKLIPLRYKRAQRHFLANRTSRDLVLKARQIGFSTAIQAEMFRLYTTAPEAMLTMADKQENTDKLRRMTERFYQHLPPKITKPIRSEANASVTVYPDIGSEVHIATAGSQTSGRASTYTLFHGSEVAYWKDAEWVISGALQAIPEHLSNTWVVFESTANGASGWFYNECMAALAGDSEWTLHFYAWWWDEDYWLPIYEGEEIIFTDEEAALAEQHNLSPEQIKWRRKKQRDLKVQFQKEHPESPEQAFLTSGGGVFTLQPHNIQHGITRHEPKDGAIYVGGLDWGQDNDYTVLSIFEVPTDGTAIREVFIDRWRKMSWSSMRGYIVDTLKAYNVEKVMPEKNAMGTALIESLRDEIYDENLDTAIHSFITTNRSKDNIVKQMTTALDEYGLQLLDVDYANHEMRIFETKQTATGLWTYGNPDVEGAHDDCVMARMLANYTASQLWI